MLLDQTLRSTIDQAASDAPTPGGGSVSALAAALGSCMGSMAANFTAGKKKFAAVDAEARQILATLAEHREALLRCAEEDAVAFEAVNAAYRLPKETEQQKAARSAAIRKSLLESMEVPLRAVRAAVACLEPLPRLAAIGNPNLISDTGVAAILLEAGARAAHLNVLINLKGLADAAVTCERLAITGPLLERAKNLLDATMQTVEAAVRPS